MRSFLHVSSLLAAVTLFSTANADFGFHSNYTAYQLNGRYGDAPGQHYLSHPELFSPIFNVPIWNNSHIDKSAPHILLAVELLGKLGPYIFSSDDLSLVYEDRSFDFVNNVRVQQYKNESLLTFWAGKVGKGYASGYCLMLNRHYEVVFNISSIGMKAGADLHECQLTHDNTVLFTIYEPTPDFDLTPVGGNSSDVLLDSVFQEIDLETGELLFTWRGSEHVPLTDSYKEYDPYTPDGWDAWHINSLQKTREGDYIVDLRRAHNIVLVSGRTGHILWHVGGKANDFKDLSGGRAVDFAWQHHSKFLDDGLTQLTVFDNHIYSDVVECEPAERCSRATRLELSHGANRTVRLVSQLFHPVGLGCYAMGSYELTPRGNSFVGWGSQAAFTEYDPDGNPVMDVAFARLGTYMRTYRVYKQTWVGEPKWNPRIALNAPGQLVALAWNGATEVRAWFVMSASRPETLATFDAFNSADDAVEVHYAPRRGFETMVPATIDGDRFIRAAAIGPDGRVLGATDIVNTKTNQHIVSEASVRDYVYSNKIDAILSPAVFMSRAYENPVE